MRFVVRDYPVYDIHPSATLAAVASRCAADQGQFWPMYELLFATHGASWGGAPERDRGAFLEFAGELGLETERFRACLDAPGAEQEVLAEAALAEEYGVNATPSFLVNGRLLRGAQPFEAFARLIELEAAR